MTDKGPAEPRTLLECLIRLQDRTHEEIADDFNELAHVLDEPARITGRHLRRLASMERPDAKPAPATGRVLAELFGRSVEELFRPCGHDEGAHILPDGPTTATVVRHKQFQKAAERAEEFAKARSRSMNNTAMENVTGEVRELAVAYMRQPLTEILDLLVEKQNEVFYELDKRRQTPDNARQLYFVASVLGGMLANAGHDLGNPHYALIQARTALLCADQANHDGLRAWSWGMQSLITFRDKRPGEAVMYAQNGAVFAKKAGGSTLAAWLPACEARAWGALHNARETQAAIERAERAWEHVGPNDLDNNFGGICSTNRAELLYYSADALTSLPADTNTARIAERYCTQAVEAYQDTSSPDWDFGCQACSHADLAIARIRRGDRDGVDEALSPVLKLPPKQRVTGIIQSVQCVQSLIADSRDMQERIEAFTRTPLRALPR